MKKILLISVLFLWSFGLMAQDGGGLEEVVVTGIRASGSDVIPGVSLRKSGDYLLLRLLVVNDTREATKRSGEIYSTLKNAIKSANSNKSIELSLIEGDFVVPLNMSNYKVKLSRGSRPDTSTTNISVKTKIPKNLKDVTKLISTLRKFVDKVPVDGRTQLEEIGSFDISVVSPNQYREKIIELFTLEVQRITSKLGDDYRVIVDGIDKPVQWVPVGPTHVSLYIPYTYKIIPKNVSTVISGEVF